jgi:cell division cycle 14
MFIYFYLFYDIFRRRQVSPGVFTLTPEEYVPVMKGLGVTCIVRFNSKCYDRNVFIQNGIRHVDLFYEDGGNPSDAILQAFLQICEHEKGAIAVHCKAGLGRTGTNIAAYMMKHYGYTAKESIAWCRMCRPGSVVGPQQQYLAVVEPRMVIEGNLYRERNGKPPLVSVSAPPAATEVIFFLLR